MAEGIKTGLSSQTDADAAVFDLQQQLTQQDISLVILFFSTNYLIDELLSAVSKYFPETKVVGCSTAGEIGGAGYTSNSIAGLSFSRAHFKVSTELYSCLDSLNLREWQDKTLKLHQHHNHYHQLMDDHTSFGLLLIDGLSRHEEPLIQTVSNSMQGIPIAGGSAGDDLKYERCFMLYQGRVHQNCAILALITTDMSFSILRSQHIYASTQRMVVTAAIPEQRIITEINGYPAAIEYARHLGIDNLEALTPDVLAAHPAVVVIGKEEYVRSIQRVNPDYSLSFYCAIDTGIVIRAGESGDLVPSLKQSFVDAAAQYRNIQAVITFDCILRRVELHQNQQLDQASSVLARYPCVGFSTYGEQVNGLHVNQTCTGIMIGERND